MQEILSMGGRRFLGGGGGGGGGGDLRMRPHHQNHQQQPLKCPRCDSLNTKFCYYNNYNLSQPRHFCKNCRRYWTKGGVLRNVPVGGGCRKSKRSNKPKSTTTATTNSPSSSSETAPATETTTTPPPPALPSQPPEPEPNSNSHSSSESSTLTVAATEAMSPPTSNAASKLDNVRESKVFTNPFLESGIGSCTGLVNSNNEPLGFGFANNNMVDATTSFRFVVSHPQGNDQVQAAPGGEQWHHQQQKHHEFGTASLLNHTVPLEFSSSLHHKTGFGSLDWQPGSDQGLFDLPNTIDQPYWSHDQDNPSLFHLP